MTDTNQENRSDDEGASATDGSFHLKISADGMEASLDKLTPATNGGKPITLEQVLSELKRHEVTYGVATDKITQTITAINSNDESAISQGPIIIATGDKAIAGKNSQFHWQLDEAQLKTGTLSMLPGELIVTYQPATQGSAGKNIHGKTIPTTLGHNTLLYLGSGIETVTTEAGDEYHAKWIGIAEFDGQSLNIDPGIKVSDDAMSVHMNIHTPVNSGAAVELHHVVDALDKNGIKHGIDKETIQQALAHAAGAAKNHLIRAVLVAKGTSPITGKDARMVISQDEMKAGQTLSHGRIDFHEHGYPRNIKKGEGIGYLMDAKAAANGMTVYGEVIEVPVAKTIEIELSGLHKDERGKLVADIDGALIVNGPHIEIVELLVINGDVAQKTGNIHSNIPIHIKGYVEPGFILESKKDVIIEKNVEDATIRSGGNVVIKGGIRGRHSELFSPGDISVGFIENAKVFVNGNITIKAGVINSEVASNSTIIAGDKRAKHSAVIGGTLTAHTLVEAVTLGSPSFAKTLIRVGIAQEMRRQLNKLETEIATKEKELNDLAQLESRYSKLTSNEAMTIMKKIAATRTALLAEINAHKNEQTEQLAILKQSETAKVVVHKNTLPGVTICINDQCLEITREFGKGSFTLTDNVVTFHPG